GELVWEERTLRTRSDCGTLVRALGLSLAIRLEPEPDPPPCPSCPACPSPAPPSPPAPAPPPHRAQAAAPASAPAGPVPLVGGGALAAVLYPLGIAAGVEVFGGLRWPHASLALEARAVLPGVGDTQGLRIKTSSFGAVLAP